MLFLEKPLVDTDSVDEAWGTLNGKGLGFAPTSRSDRKDFHATLYRAQYPELHFASTAFQTSAQLEMYKGRKANSKTMMVLEHPSPISPIVGAFGTWADLQRIIAAVLARRRRVRSGPDAIKITSGYPALRPPSTVKIAPLMKAASSEHRNTAQAAMSLGSHIRPNGMSAARRSKTSSSFKPICCITMGVRAATGCQCVDADVVARQFDREGAGKGDDGALAGGIGSTARPGPEGGGGRRVEDAAAATLLHLGHGSGGEELDALDVDGEDAVVEIFRHIGRLGERIADAGIVQNRVDPAKSFHRRLDGLGHVAGLADVGPDKLHLAAFGPDCGGNALAAVLVDIDAQDLCPFGGEAVGEGFAKSGRGAGDHRNLVLQTHVWLLSPLNTARRPASYSAG